MSPYRKCAIAFGILISLQAEYTQRAFADTFTGYITATNINTSANLGYVANFFNLVGEAGLTNDSALRLTVSFSNNNSPFSITTLNGPPATLTFPFLGGIVGAASTNDNIGPGSFNFVVLGGTASGTAFGQNTFTLSTGTSKKSKSPLWSLGGSNALTAQWVNSDASLPVSHIMYINGILLLTGDVTAFQTMFGLGQEVALTFVSADAAVPLPAALPLFATGLGALGLLGWRRKRKAHAEANEIVTDHG